MDEEEMDEKIQQAKDKLLAAVEEYIVDVHKSPQMLLGASLVYETTRYEDETQYYGTYHVMLGSAAMNLHVGLLSTIRSRLINYMNRGYEGG